MASAPYIYTIKAIGVDTPVRVPEVRDEKLGNEDCYTSAYLSRLGIASDRIVVPATNGAVRNAMQRNWGTSIILDNAEGEEFTSDPLRDAALSGRSWLYLSGRTLRKMDNDQANRVFQLAKELKSKGGQVVLDPKFESYETIDRMQIQQLMTTFAEVSTIVVASLSKEDQFWGRPASHRGTIATGHHAKRWFEAGVRLVVLKCGAKGAELHEPGVPVRRISMPHPVSPIDLAGAGDSFNAALIAGLARGKTLDYSARLANTLSGIVVGHEGALAPEARVSRLESMRL
nr:PfkB family carbohydrate kinase [Hyphomonas sp. Mor2]